jgi:ribosomal protein S18 acetylase RimI-like enzyme
VSEPDVVYRRATTEDAPQLAELRGVMIDSFTGSTSTPEDPWWAASVDWFRTQLAGDDVVAFVAEADGRLLAGAVGIRERRPPRPSNLSGWAAHVSSVATRREARRRGHARAVVGLLVDWFDAAGIPSLDLTTSVAAESIYRSLGFTDHAERYLRRNRPPRD